MALGPTIRRLRQERQLQINELAMRLSRPDPSYLGKIERGEVPNLSSELMAQIAMALDVSIDYLYMEAGVLPADHDPGELDSTERDLIRAIRGIGSPSVRQRVLEQLTWIAEVARDADLARQPRLKLAAEEHEEYQSKQQSDE